MQLQHLLNLTGREHADGSSRLVRVRHGAILLPSPRSARDRYGCFRTTAGSAADIQRGPSLRGRWKWWTCGNRGIPDFYEPAGTHFQNLLLNGSPIGAAAPPA